ncbi:hypothetical protein [Streptomyces sp. NPDC018059]|uniref:hypothetical protein n=1 Tax=Streptomyces sp. NPDC018059 TaxID=3365041 RepID=UPI003793348B
MSQRNETDGPRWHRLAVGAMLFLAMGGVGVGLLVATFGDGASPLARTGLGAGAVSTLAVAWWCARYWYAAFSEGRRAEPVPEPNACPWALPWTVGTASLLATGVRQVRAGDSAGWFTLGFGGLIGLPLCPSAPHGSVPAHAVLHGARITSYGQSSARRRPTGLSGLASTAPRLGPHRLRYPRLHLT